MIVVSGCRRSFESWDWPIRKRSGGYGLFQANNVGHRGSSQRVEVLGDVCKAICVFFRTPLWMDLKPSW